MGIYYGEPEMSLFISFIDLSLTRIFYRAYDTNALSILALQIISAIKSKWKFM